MLEMNYFSFAHSKWPVIHLELSQFSLNFALLLMIFIISLCHDLFYFIFFLMTLPQTKAEATTRGRATSTQPRSSDLSRFTRLAPNSILVMKYHFEFKTINLHSHLHSYQYFFSDWAQNYCVWFNGYCVDFEHAFEQIDDNIVE